MPTSLSLDRFAREIKLLSAKFNEARIFSVGDHSQGVTIQGAKDWIGKEKEILSGRIDGATFKRLMELGLVTDSTQFFFVLKRKDCSPDFYQLVIDRRDERKGVPLRATAIQDDSGGIFG